MYYVTNEVTKRNTSFYDQTQRIFLHKKKTTNVHSINLNMRLMQTAQNLDSHKFNINVQPSLILHIKFSNLLIKYGFCSSYSQRQLYAVGKSQSSA